MRPRNGSATTVGDGSANASASAAVDADLDGLAPFAGKLVRVGGLVVDLRTDGFTLDDGTAIGRIVLRGAALELLPLIEPDDALNAIGRVETSTDGFVVAVDDPGGIILTGDPVAATGPAASQAVGAAGPSDGGDPSPLGTSRFAGFGSATLAHRCRRRGGRDAARDLGALGGGDPPPTVSFAPPFGGQDRRPAGLVRGPGGGPPRPERG